jgi:hypothetical protein
MRSVAGLVPFALIVVAACSKDEPPPATPAPSAQPYTPPPGQPGMQPGAPPPATAPAPGQMAVPGPTALACQNDSQCMTHRCNLQYQKCAFPCQSDADCIQGTSCLMPGQALSACMPKMGGGT